MHSTEIADAPHSQTTRYNDFFATEAEARLAWGAYRIIAGIEPYMDKPLPPLPGEYPQRTTKHSSNGSNLFAAVIDAYPVEDLAGQFTDLLPAGPGAIKGKCPLHAGGKERTPSFHIYVNSQRWKCFGACARGGDVIELARLLMDKGLLK